ncbi:hypothetical protein [Curtobacterium sp. ZW137]|uniref:hypothetical protein n=1 Tax=Curtobacterium sp. ZW137 TaxID=2485104 RepID=UPI000F4B9E6D|nr:hypothetical protein [Curtobacterium sp. ZW137]
MSEPTSNSPEAPEPRSRAMLGLLVVLALEFLALVVTTVALIVELLVSPASSVASGIALVVLTAIAALWLGSMLVGLWRGRSWVRSGIIVWQVLQGALAIGAFQGVFRVPAVGWALLLPALVAITLVLSKSVTTALARRVE